jgi:hypothetical protein
MAAELKKLVLDVSQVDGGSRSGCGDFC